MSYTPPDLSTSLILLKQIIRPPDLSEIVVLDGAFQNIVAAGFDSSNFTESNTVSNLTQKIYSVGFNSSEVPADAEVHTKLTPTNLGLVVLERREVYPGFIWGVVLRPKDEVDTPITLSAYGFDSQAISDNTFLESSIRSLFLEGIATSTDIGVASIKNNNTLARTQGFNSSAYGRAEIVNRNKSITTYGFVASAYGQHLTYNLVQYRYLQGFSASEYGTAYLQGGVRWLNAYAINAPAVSYPSVINTTANQYAYPYGIERTAIVPAPIVTPHMIYAHGIYGTAFGSAKVIPTPVLRHKGVNHFEAGKTTVWYHTRPLSPNSFESYDTGYPKVFDPTQFIQPSAFNRTAIFGDTYAKNIWTFVKAAGAINSAIVSQWSVVENRDRVYVARGFLSQAFGNQLIKNKSPSIFFHGLPAPIFYSQSIGYRIRKVSPTGFDRLGLGNPTVIKTPELFPRSYIATQFGTQWVSNRTRYIEQYGKDYSAAGTPILWFRFRYARPNSWQSSNFSNSSTVTHGVREVIGNGFIQQGYGVAWVSRGIRLLEPTSIYKDYPSNHYVGRHQEIKPFGYIATQFGLRIIPDIQALYPQGFAGVFGQTTAYLRTQYLKPKGYLSAGEQPAFRWGRQIVQNSIQYITQNYDGDSGLVPPKWSDYQSIENRDKTIRTIGSSMQKFGYSQIDNGARLLEPLGLLATQFNKSMISHGVRYLSLSGIDSPYMSDYFIVHNAARVIAAKGFDSVKVGNSSIETNRRYLDRIGRIESFEAGTPMIAYRIRTLDIEKRYSIAPPLIKLPTVDLYTRYIEFNGYETAKYGLASLSIHFRIITPRWTHNEKLGEPALRNVTPELLARGHDSQEYGTTNIRTQWRNVYAQGDNTAAIGLLKISDTKQHISVRGFIDSLASQKHTVIQGESAPYSLQYIYLNDENNSSAGEGFGIYQFAAGRPAFNQNVLYHAGHRSSTFGTAFIWTNNIRIESGIGIDGVSKNLVISNKNNEISLFNRGIDNTITVGRPIISPHTIYATTESSAQAQANHPTPRGLHKVGEFDGGRNSSRFGFPSLESTIRFLDASWPYTSARYGTPSLDLSKKFIKPDGFRLGRFGLPSIPFTLQNTNLRNGIYSTSFGETKVLRPPYIGPQYIASQGLYGTLFGSVYADNLVRTLSAYGVNSLAMGQSKNNDTPFMWQGLRVGEHVPLIIGAGDTSRHGNTTIWLKVREIGAEGFNAFRSEYELSNFKEHMTVKNADKKLPSKTTVTATGIESNNAFGYQDIKLGQHYIRPDGNSDQFRKGGHHA